MTLSRSSPAVYIPYLRFKSSFAHLTGAYLHHILSLLFVCSFDRVASSRDGYTDRPRPCQELYGHRRQSKSAHLRM